jgi:hypothetical protein
VSRDFKYYINAFQACRAQRKVSLFAARRGECSQTEVRAVGGGAFIGGYPGDLARAWPKSKIIAQFSGGYRVTSQGANS